MTYTFDALNRVTLNVIPDACVSGYACTTPPANAVRDVYYGYELGGQQLYARFGSASGAGLSNAYDGFGRVASASNDLSGTALTLSYAYDADSNRTRITHPDGAYFTTGYDGLDRPTYAGWYAASVGTVPFMAIAYDARGQRVSTVRGSSATGYTYDAVSRLAGLTQNFAGGTGNAADTFAYNPASQLVSRTRSNTDYAWTGYVNVSRSYTANGLNQYDTAGAAAFSYDANGNLTGDGTSTFGYDVENRLVTKSGGVSLSYDPLGRLWQVSGASGTTRFLHDGDRLAAEYDGSGTLLRRYMFAGQDEPILQDEGGALDCSGGRFLDADERGSIVAVADCWGTRQAVNSYDEYGIPAATNVARFQYTGQMWLPELGMYYYKARIYSPSLGRFLQTDPIGYADQNNLYAYVGSDPVNGTDLTGLCTENACPVSGFWGSTAYNLKVWNIESKASAPAVPILAAIILSPVAYFALDSTAVSIGARGFQASRTGLQAAERLPTDGLRRTMTGAIDEIRNIIVNNGTRSDFVGAARESRGIQTGFDHVTEMRSSIKGLTEALKSIQGSLKNPNLSDGTRATLNAWRNAAQSTLSAMQKALRD